MITQGGERMMKLWLRDIGTLLPVALLCLGLSSCIYDDGTMADEPGVPADSYMVSFQLLLKSGRTQNHDASSRADDKWEDQDDPDRLEGDGTDNYIDFQTMRIGVYDAADNLAAKVEDVLPVRIPGTADAISQSERYECIGEMKFVNKQIQKGFPNGNDYKVLVFLNTPGTEPVPATLDAANALTFERIGTDADVENAGGIPMWGFVTTAFTGIKAGERYNLKDIYMLRAMAKVRIEIAEDSKKDKWTITSVKVNNTNSNGYSLPAWNPLSDKATTDLSLANNLHVPASNTFLDNPKFEKLLPKETLIMYLPEKSNIKDANKCTMDVTVSNGSSQKSGNIKFVKYNDGQPTNSLLDIIRNHYYTFTIECKDNVNALRFKVTIADMQKGDDYVYEYE